ncbi:MAG: DUF2141 domain-containing protein [Sphingomonadaceae bacterium]
MRNRSRLVPALTLALAAPLLHAASLPSGHVSATVTGLRSTEGKVLACLTARPQHFPQCEKDPEARSLIVKAGARVNLDFGNVPAGEYAIAIIHDENANGRLDKRLMMPREGFGFSQNAPVRFGPPSFGKAAFEVDGKGEHQSIRMRYIL